MSRLIDADVLRRELIKGHDLIGAKYVDLAPDIDAVEVVRCKDCAKREYCRTTNVWATVPDDDWFCADAERRSE